jgi:heme exporter protein CcmD
MDWSAPHAGFVAAAYGLSFAVIAALVAYVLLRDRAARKDAEALEK